MFTFVYDAHKNKKKDKNNDKRVISIAQLCLSAVLKPSSKHAHNNIISQAVPKVIDDGNESTNAKEFSVTVDQTNLHSSIQHD